MDVALADYLTSDMRPVGEMPNSIFITVDEYLQRRNEFMKTTTNIFVDIDGEWVPGGYGATEPDADGLSFWTDDDKFPIIPFDSVIMIAFLLREEFEDYGEWQEIDWDRFYEGDDL